jgi:hypothetical protein
MCLVMSGRGPRIIVAARRAVQGKLIAGKKRTGFEMRRQMHRS